ncbi:gamma-glutamyltransferase 5a [Clupea harengus]|uniref:Glutathione hydrolase n=1 Tax=Clupea harengus TaxID=7950 RepID=A0A6P3VJ22_CLUHA|nr:gamma-glutamyltransferase 5a [Clupea harengus]
MAKPTLKLCMCLCLVLNSIVIIGVLCVALLTHQGCSDEDFGKAAVAADSEMCSKIGRDTLRRGGSAVDGAIATLVCTSIIHPQSMGIGGGSIFTIREKDGKVKIINSRETVPKGFNSKLMTMCPKSFQLMSGNDWIGVPGEIRGYEEAHRRYGRLPWASLFEPTIKMAREGFPLPPVLARFLTVLDKDKTLPVRNLFVDRDGNLLKEGDTLRFEKLADTLEIIAEKGADAFYTGDIARDLISDIQEAGGKLSLEDLSLFSVQVLDAWKVPLGDYDMYIPPPPAGGAVLSFILNTMRGYKPTPASLEGQQKTLTFQRYVETSKFANALRRFLSDPRFRSSKEALAATQEEFAERTRAMIQDSQTHDAQYYNVTPSLDSMGTTHVSVLAEDGMAVSITSTINHIFGSRVFSPKTGIILNNELSDFCGKASSIQAGEQPPSSMSPAILYSKSKKHTMVVGGSGGSMIITGMALTIMNHLWMGKSLKDAISAPVVFVDSKNALNFEPNFDKGVEENLKALGHVVEQRKMFYNVINAVSKKDGCITAVSDERKLGKAAGY